MAVHKEETMLEKLNAVRPLFHLIVALTMQFVALSIVTPAIIGVIVEAICPPGHAECGRVIFLSGFQQMVHTWTHIVPLNHKHNSDLFQFSRNTQLMPNFISNCVIWSVNRTETRSRPNLLGTPWKRIHMMILELMLQYCLQLRVSDATCTIEMRTT